MFLDLIFIKLFTIFWLLLFFYWWFINNFWIENQDMLKNSLIIHWWIDYNLKINAYNNPSEINDWDKLETLKDVAFLETSKKQNFVNLNIWKVKWTFELEFSAPSKISWVVYRKTNENYDVQFTQSLNKYSITSSYTDATRSMRLSLDENAFKNNFSQKNMAYYVFVPKEKPIKKIYFDSTNENTDIIISLFVEPYNISQKPEEQNTAKIMTNVKNDKQKYYDWVRYILKKSDLKNVLELKNFNVVRWTRQFWATWWVSQWNNTIIINYSSPLMFYVNEFSDYDENPQ